MDQASSRLTLWIASTNIRQSEILARYKIGCAEDSLAVRTQRHLFFPYWPAASSRSKLLFIQQQKAKLECHTL